MEEADKIRLRRYFSEVRRNLPEVVRREADRKICDAIRQLPIYRQARCVASFVRLDAEPDLSALWGEKRTFLPRFDAARQEYELVEIHDPETELVTGKYHIPEPRPELPAASGEFIAQEMLFLVPAVACDGAGTRLGRGGGYYDRLLQGAQLPAIGIIYAAQFSTELLPREAHDRPLGFVVTEEKIWQCQA